MSYGSLGLSSMQHVEFGAAVTDIPRFGVCRLIPWQPYSNLFFALDLRGKSGNNSGPDIVAP